MTSVTNLSRSGVPHTKTSSSEIAFFFKDKKYYKIVCGTPDLDKLN